MAVSSGTAKVTLPADEQILITREFDAPKHLVYKAFTTPELVKRWWHANRGEMTVAEIDLREGGKWRYVMVAEGDFEVGFHGEYREIVPNERIVSTEVYEGAPEGGTLNTATFAEDAGRGGRQHDDPHRSRRPHDARDPRAAREQGAPGRPHRVRHGSGHAGRDGPPGAGRSLASLIGRDGHRGISPGGPSFD